MSQEQTFGKSLIPFIRSGKPRHQPLPRANQDFTFDSPKRGNQTSRSAVLVSQNREINGHDFKLDSPNLANRSGVIAPQNGGANQRGGHNRRDYLLSLDMAKELAMVERTDKGHRRAASSPRTLLTAPLAVPILPLPRENGGAGCGSPSFEGAQAPQHLRGRFFHARGDDLWRAARGHLRVCRLPSSRSSTPVRSATLRVEAVVAALHSIEEAMP